MTAEVLGIVEKFLQRRFKRPERIAAYLDEVAQEAEALAGYWTQIYKHYKTGVTDPKNDERSKEFIDGLYELSCSQMQAFEKLMAFYTDLYRAIFRKSDENFDNSFITTLSCLLQARIYARERVDAELSKSEAGAQLDRKGDLFDTKQLDEAIMSIFREAATLRALAARYRANNA